MPRDFANYLAPMAPVLARLDSKMTQPIRLSENEFRQLVRFVRFSLLDPRVIELDQFDPELKTISHNVDGIGNATSTGQLGFGYNKVSATFDAYNFDNPAGRMMADARTFWKDEVLIDSPGLTGTVGTFTASLRIQGSANFNMDGGYATEDTYADLYGFWDSWIGTSTDNGASFLVGGWSGNWYSDHFGGTDYFGDDLTQPMTDVT